MMARLVTALLGVAMVAVAAVMVLWLLLGAAAVCGLLYGGWCLWRGYQARAGARRHRRAELLARAEIQHRWYLAGDSRGIHGRYPPARV